MFLKISLVLAVIYQKKGIFLLIHNYDFYNKFITFNSDHVLNYALIIKLRKLC
jgi:hypothetical protein